MTGIYPDRDAWIVLVVLTVLIVAVAAIRRRSQ